MCQEACALGSLWHVLLPNFTHSWPDTRHPCATVLLAERYPWSFVGSVHISSAQTPYKSAAWALKAPPSEWLHCEPKWMRQLCIGVGHK